MSKHDSWGDFLDRKWDDSVMQTGRCNPLSDVIDLERRYLKKYGITITEHGSMLSKTYSLKEAWKIVGQYIAALDAEKRHAAELEQMQYSFHAVPDDVEIPF